MFTEKCSAASSHDHRAPSNLHGLSVPAVFLRFICCHRRLLHGAAALSAELETDGVLAPLEAARTMIVPEDRFNYVTGIEVGFGGVWAMSPCVTL